MKKTNYKFILGLLAITLILMAFMSLGGCEAMDNFMMPGPNGEPAPAEQIAEVGQGVGVVATSAGLPFGIIITGISSALASIAGTYTQMRKKQKATEDIAVKTEVTFKAVVEAVEALKAVPVTVDGVKTNLADVIKKEVGDQLRNRRITGVGEAVINSIKDIRS